MSGGMTSMSIDFPELDVLKDMPGFKAIMRALLKQQIQQLVEQLANHTGDECIVLTASVTDGTLCHLGTRAGKHFLNSRDEIKSQFLRHCLKRQESQLPQDSTNISPLHSNIEEPVLNKTIPDIFPRKRRRCGSNSNAFLNSQTSQRDVGKTIQNAEPVSRNSHGLSSFHQKHQQGDHNSAKQSRLSSTGVSLPTETQSWQFQNQHTSQLTGQSPHMSEGGVQNLSSEMIELSSDDEGHEIKTERDLDTKQQAKDRNHSSVSLAGSNMAAPKLTVTGSFSTAASNTSMPSASSASSSKMIDLFSSTANRAFQGKEGMPVSASSSSQRAESVDISKIKSEPVDESSIQSELLGEGNTTGLSETDWLQNVTTGMDFQLTMQPGTANSSQADGFVSGISGRGQGMYVKAGLKTRPFTGNQALASSQSSSGFVGQGQGVSTSQRQNYGSPKLLFTCEFCGKFCKYKHHLDIHRRIHTGEKPYTCDICRRTFAHISNLVAHRRNHRNAGAYSCSTCEMQFKNCASFSKHVKSTNH